MLKCLSTKKCIVADLVQLALILNILHNSNVLYPENPQLDPNENVNLTQFPDIGNEILPDGIFGSTFYSRTSAYHQAPEFNRTPHISAKQLDDPPASSIINETNEWILRDDNAYYRERIIEELRRLSVQRYSELPRETAAKGSLTFQDITAYLFDNTNEPQTFLDNEQSGSGTGPGLVTTTSTFESTPSASSFLSLSSVENVSALEPAASDLDLELLQEMEEISANFKDGFPIQELFSQNNLRQDELTLLEQLQNQLNDDSREVEAHPAQDEIHGQAPVDLGIPSRMLGNVNTDLRLTLNNTALPESLEPLESDVLVEDDFGELSWQDDVYPLENNMADEEDILQEFNLLISGQEAPRRRYDTDDITEEEMMDTISPYDIHGPVKSEEGMGTVANVTPPTAMSEEWHKIERQQRGRGISSSGGSVSSHDDLLNLGEEDDVGTARMDSLLDELWETDSGIFDSFLDSPGRLDTDDENLRTQSSSLTNDVPRRSVYGDSCSEESRDVEDPSSSDEMLQTAPIHTGGRPTPHPAQPRAFQVHGTIAGPLRGNHGSEPRAWQDFPTFLNFPPSHGDPNGPLVPPSLPHHFGAHAQIHHPFHHPTSLHHHHPHHAIHHHSPYGTPYTSESSRSALIHNATIPPPELHLNGTYPGEMGPPPNLGSALTSSMHLTNTSEPMSDPTSSHYNKILENSHDALFYNSSSHPNPDLNNQTNEGNLTSLINDETLLDMMVMNEGMYAMRMIDNTLSQNGGSLVGGSNLGGGASGYSLGGTGVSVNTEDRMEASSDSAVSSMGSERVPPMIDPILSDNEWSESEHHQHSSNNYGAGGEYTSGKLRGYDYFGKSDSRHRVVVPVPQKKHQMFGKRLLQEQGNMGGLHPFSLSSHPIPPYAAAGGLHHSSNPSLDSIDMKYNACGLDFARHDTRIGGTLDLASSNHSYSLPPTHPDNPIMTARTQRAPPKEKPQKKEHMSRDEKKATMLGLPLTTDEIVNLPMDEFNERLSKHDLSETQLSLIRDIRRRGKNKVAAQNCRKRKIDQITQLENEVTVIRQRKESLLRENDNLVTRRNAIKEKYSQLYRHVFQNLRNPDGNPYNPQEWTLLQGTDGNVNLIPRQQNVPGMSSSNYASTSDASVHDESGTLRRPNRSSTKSKEDTKKEGGSS